MREALRRIFRPREKQRVVVEPRILAPTLISSMDYLGDRHLLTEENINYLKERGALALLKKLKETDAEEKDPQAPMSMKASGHYSDLFILQHYIMEISCISLRANVPIDPAENIVMDGILDERSDTFRKKVQRDPEYVEKLLSGNLPPIQE